MLLVATPRQTALQTYFQSHCFLLLTLLLVTLLKMRSDGIASIVAHFESALYM